jgi:hypothetical protein
VLALRVLIPRSGRSNAIDLIAIRFISRRALGFPGGKAAITDDFVMILRGTRSAG